MNRKTRSVDGVDEGAPERRGEPRRRGARRWPPLFGAALALSCGALVGGDAPVGGETHFLVTCDTEDCGFGLSCIAGVCTRGCEPGYSSCWELSGAASCQSAGQDEGALEGFAGMCEVTCGEDADCASLGGDHSCRAGVCRADVASSSAPLSTSSPRLVHAVDVDTCRSGLRWAGSDTPSAEMLPGSDCLSCHGDGSALPLAIGGTVYSHGDPRGPLPLDDCFGLEGVEVIIEDAAGGVHTTRTNRAGNFFFEGQSSDIPLPYSASIRWTWNGDEVVTLMGTSPRYGGCARCHGAEAPAGAGTSPERVIPVGPIFTPGLYPSEPPP